MYCERRWCRDLYITGFLMYIFKVKLMLVWMRARRHSGSQLYGVRSFLIRCAVWGLVAWPVACGAENMCVSMVVVYLCLRVSLYWGYISLGTYLCSKCQYVLVLLFYTWVRVGSCGWWPYLLLLCCSLVCSWFLSLYSLQSVFTLVIILMFITLDLLPV